MYLATIKQLQERLSLSDDNQMKAQLGSLLGNATVSMGTRLDTDFNRSNRVSIFSLMRVDLRTNGSTVAFRLGNACLDDTTEVVIRRAVGGELLTDETDGEIYEGKKIVDRRKGIVHIPKTELSEGSFSLSIAYVSGFPKTGSDYKGVPAELQQGAISLAVRAFYQTAKANVSARYNKFDAKANEQMITDAYSRYDRPRAGVIWDELDTEYGV